MSSEIEGNSPEPPNDIFLSKLKIVSFSKGADSRPKYKINKLT